MMTRPDTPQPDAHDPAVEPGASDPVPASGSPSSPTRRITPLRLAAALLLLVVIGLATWAVLPWFDRPDVQGAHQALRDAAMQLIRENNLARPDGQVYTVDIAQLAVYAAKAGDRELFDPLRRIILDRLYVDRGPSNEATGMVAWGYRPGQPLDASGTTETLRAAEALWHGIDAFGYEADRGIVHAMAKAYARHQDVEWGVWIIRNYYHLIPPHRYVTNSFLIDYDPDFLHVLAEAFDDEALREVVRKSVELIGYARTEGGLLHQVIRPEVATIQWTGQPPGFYSINGIEQISNVLATAERCVETRPQTARRIAEFVRERRNGLYLYYWAHSGEPASGGSTPLAGAETWAPALRLAVKLGDRELARFSLERVIELSAPYAAPGREASADKLYILGESLLALRAWIAFERRQ